MSRLVDISPLIEEYETCKDRACACSHCGIDVQCCQDMINLLVSLPSVEPEAKPIEYRECSDALLRMWMDNVITDGEYNRIMDKLNARWKRRSGNE